MHRPFFWDKNGMGYATFFFVVFRMSLRALFLV